MNSRKEFSKQQTVILVYFIYLFSATLLTIITNGRFHQIAAVSACLIGLFMSMWLAHSILNNGPENDFFLEYDQMVKLRQELQELRDKYWRACEIIGQHEAMKMIDKSTENVSEEEKPKDDLEHSIK